MVSILFVCGFPRRPGSVYSTPFCQTTSQSFVSIVLSVEKAMDSETGTAILVVSTTIFHAWVIYASFYWISNNCECV
jgi:hypothetical protein